MNTTTTHYAYGNNTPGCLPDNPCFVANTFADALHGLIWDMRFHEDHADTESEAEAISAAQQDVNLWSEPDSITVAGRCFWIMETQEEAD